MRNTVLVLLLTVVSVAAAQAEAKPGYRLAGIVAVGSDYLGFLELPDGGQVLVRQGTAIGDGGRIVALDNERLKIAFPDRTIELSLEDSGKPGTAPNTQGIVVGQSDQGHVMVRQVDSAALSQALATSRTSTKAPDAGIEVGQRFAGLINLPNNARVLAVNEVPVTSADSALKLAETSLAEGTPVRLNLAAASGDPETRVYLLPTRN
jgi:hypothetical protein